MPILLSLILLLAALTPASSLAKGAPQGTGGADVPANILFMFDTSGSMSAFLRESGTEYVVDLDYDSDGNLYVAKQYDTVTKYRPDGFVIRDWGEYDGTDDPGKFDFIHSIAIDSNDNIYVSDYGHGRVQVFDTDGEYLRELELASAPALGVEVDSNDNVYALNGNGTIEKFNSSGTKIATFGNSGGYYLAITPTDQIFVTKYGSRKVQEYDTSGNYQGQISVSYSPYGIGSDASGNIFVSDYRRGGIYEYTSSRSFVQQHGSYGTQLGKFRYPHGVQMGPDGVMYVADYANDRIQSIDGVILLEEDNNTQLEVLQNVVKTIVSDSDLTAGANFGLVEWNTRAELLVEISDTGGAEIYTAIDDFRAGGQTNLDDAMDVAYGYFTGNDSPQLADADCQKNVILVLSDGYWTDNTASATAQTLLDDHNIETFVIGFATTGNENYITLSQAGGSYPNSPLYASDEAGLLEVLSLFIRQTTSSRLTFATPTIIPGISTEDSILQSTFTYDEDHQWKGHFIKYSLESDGGIGSALWDAGEELNSVAAAARNIWTVADGIASGLNNFTASNVDRLRDLLEENTGTAFSDEELEALIDFVRGVDSYNEYPANVDDEGDVLISGERWKLADVYHSRAVVVGPPTAYASNLESQNTEAYYRYTNGYANFRSGETCGGVCSERDEVIYVGSNGGMLHAFDSETGAEKWAFVPPSIIPNFKDMISTESGKSVSIYGVDGSPIVKDIYFDEAWHTVLFSGVRQGGHSYFALDITNPDSPEHLFTFMHNPLTDEVSYWNAAGSRTVYDINGFVPAEYDYSGLGEAWSDPVISRLWIDGQDKWVGIIGGGFNSAVNPNYGSSIFLIDMAEGGQIIENISISDGSSANNIVNAVPPRVKAVTADDTSLINAKGALVYVNDLEGRMWKLNLTSDGVLYDLDEVFDGQATYDNDRLTYHEMASTLTDDSILVHYFGTGDMQRIGRTSAAIQNRGMAVYDRNFPNMTSASAFTSSSMKNATNTTGECPDITQYGWYVNMEENERVTGSATIKNGTIFFPRYTPNTGDVCSAGTGSLSEHDFLCGDKDRQVSLGSGMPTEVIVYKNKVYIGISSDADVDDDLPEGFEKEGNLIVGDPANPVFGTVRVESWREAY